MRARTLAVAAALSISILFAGASSREAHATVAAATDTTCPAKELGATEGTLCRQLTLFGIRFTPKLMRIRVIVPKGTPPNSLGGATVKLYWRNSDRVDHQIQSTVARDAEGNLLAMRDSEGNPGTCEATPGDCPFEIDESIPRRPDPTPGQKREPGKNSEVVTFPKPGSYTFQCAIHLSMTQTVVITTGQKYR